MSSILAADKKAPAAARRRAAGLQNGGWPAAPPKAAALHEREEDEITPAELAARPFFYPALTLDMLNKNRLQVGGNYLNPLHIQQGREGKIGSYAHGTQMWIKLNLEVDGANAMMLNSPVSRCNHGSYG